MSATYLLHLLYLKHHSADTYLLHRLLHHPLSLPVLLLPGG